MHRVMLIAGEASGDLHGSNLVREALRLDPALKFYGMGGDRLREAGMELLFDLEHMAVMGVTEVIAGLGKVLSTLGALKKSLREDKPDALVLIDYPDFNLILAKAAHKLGIPVFYYICPQIWAWRTGRIKKMERLVDRRVVVFPFEVDFYKSHGVKADFVGHPLLDIMEEPRPVAQVKEELGFDPDRPLLLLMPGSRKHLVSDLLPLMLDSVDIVRKSLSDLQVVLARADTMSLEYLEPIIGDKKNGLIVKDGGAHVLQNAADAALVCSGTSTLETALMLTPMVVVYKMSGFSFFMGKMLVNTEHVSMANLIAGERLVPELLQNDARPDKMAEELMRFMGDAENNQRIISGLKLIRQRLGEPGAGRRAAQLLIDAIGSGYNKDF